MDTRREYPSPTYRGRSIKELKEGGFLETSKWNAVCAVTFTLKQGIYWHGYYVRGEPREYSRALNHFMNRLNRKVYGRAFRQHHKRLRIIPVLEKGKGGGWHYHACLERPAHISEFRFKFLVPFIWRDLRWAKPRVSVTFSADQGWTDYLLTSDQKQGFDNWSDCIDWDCYFNGLI
jgi:hypothetical protein